MSKRLLAVLPAVVIAVALTQGVAEAGEGVYYQDPVTADRPVQVPPTASCTVTLADDYVTNDAAGNAQDYDGTFAPPASCAGPWAKVVLNWTGREAGRQYDRAGGITFGGAQIFFTSTPDPTRTGSPGTPRRTSRSTRHCSPRASRTRSACRTIRPES
jgi:hypothetical protein